MFWKVDTGRCQTADKDLKRQFFFTRIKREKKATFIKTTRILILQLFILFFWNVLRWFLTEPLVALFSENFLRLLYNVYIVWELFRTFISTVRLYFTAEFWIFESVNFSNNHRLIYYEYYTLWDLQNNISCSFIQVRQWHFEWLHTTEDLLSSKSFWFFICCNSWVL